MTKRLAACILVVALWGWGAVAGAQVAAERARHLQYGINTSIWFAQSPGKYTVDRLRTFTTEDDLALIAKLGFDHIRLSIDPVPLTAWEHQQPDGQAFMTELDRVVGSALADHLSVILDIHPESSYKQPLLQGDSGVDRFVDLWRALAAHFSNRDPEHVFFELMNEPEQNDPYRWQGIESMLATQIHEVAPRFTLIAAGAHWSGLDDLLQMTPLADPDVIYTFHDYEPFAFTHQGATWTSPEVQPLRHVPYPATEAGIAENMDQSPTLEGKYFVKKYALDRWDAERIDRSLEFAEMWSKKYRVPVYCGEFGVHRPFADDASRYRWLHDMRVALEHHHIGWAMWDYQTNFGAVVKADGRTIPDEGVTKALGLHSRP